MISSSTFSGEPKALVAETKPAAEPAHRVAAIYFHSTDRYPACKKMSAYIEEAVKEGFAKETKGGQVSCLDDRLPDKNEDFKACQRSVLARQLVLADVHAAR